MTAVWTAPRTWANNELVDQTIMNQHVRDNMDWLKNPLAGVASFSSNFATTSVSMVDVTGATVTITSNGGGFDVQFRASVGCSGIATAGFQLVIDGVTEVLLGSIVFAAGEVKPVELCHHVPAKSIASHTFKIQAYTNAGTLTVYGSSSGYGSPQLYVVERGG